MLPEGALRTSKGGSSDKTAPISGRPLPKHVRIATRTPSLALQKRATP